MEELVECEVSAFGNTYSKKKVFLTGHTGFKGSWLGEWLNHLGAEVTGFSKDIPTSPSHFETIGLAKRLKDLRGDIRDLPALSKAMAESKPEIIFHLAAQPLVRASYERPVETFAENVMGTAHVLEAARHVPGVRAVVVITTDKVYENKEQDEGYRESDHLGGHDPYSASKAAAEIVSSSYIRSFYNGENGIRACTARAGNVIGGGDWAEDRLVPDSIRAWKDKQSVVLRNPTYVRPWQHVLEPLSGYLLLGQRLLNKPEGVHGEAFNFGPAEEMEQTAEALVKELEKQWAGTSHKVEAAKDAGQKKEMRMLRLNCEKAAQRLRWQPYLDFFATASWTTEWYRDFLANPASAAELTKKQIQKYEGFLKG
ncbi:MAG: CDP-glucose 4,6-dehydratase [Bdellovibrionota bacterium]